MTIKYNQPQEPSFWRLGLDCNHVVTLTPQELINKRVESRFNAATNSHDDVIVCPRCSADRPMPGDFCTQTHLHRVIAAQPLFQRQLQQQKEQPKS